MSSTCKVRIFDRYEFRLKNNKGTYDQVKIDIFSISGEERFLFVEKERSVNNFYRKSEPNLNK